MTDEHPRASGDEDALIVNVHARSGREGFEAARELLRARGREPARCIALEDAAGLVPAVDEALRAGARLVIVGGGDGTVAAAAGRLAGRDAVLGVLPLGTANSFARSVGVPTALAEAVDVIVDGEVARVDLGRVDEHWFANSAAIGVPSAVAASGELDELKRRFGRAGYLLGGLRRFLGWRGFWAEVETDSGRHAYRSLEILVANGRYHGGVLVTWQADVASGVLVARVVKGRRPVELAYAWLRSAIGRPAGREHVALVEFTRATIDVRPRQPVTVDGEVLAWTPVRVEVVPRALQLLVPRTGGH